MRINDRLKGKIKFTVDKSKEQILEDIKVRKKSYNWTDLISEPVDFSEIMIEADELTIIRRPTFFSPLRTHGKIVLKIVETEDSKSIIEGETLPFNGYAPLLVFLIFGFFSLWTAGVFVFTAELQNALLMTSFAWGVFGLLIFLISWFHKRGLMNYTKKIVSELGGYKKASR